MRARGRERHSNATDDVQRLEAAGVDAILVGESLMREPDIGAAVDRLLGHHFEALVS